jgi:hypothetical protein
MAILYLVRKIYVDFLDKNTFIVGTNEITGTLPSFGFKFAASG